MKKMSKRVRFVARHCFDIIIFSILCFTVYAIHKWSMPHQRGFFCSDESLQYPYRSSTVSVNTLVTLVLTVPTLVIITVEILQLYDYNDNHNRSKNNNSNNINNNKKLQQRLDAKETHCLKASWWQRLANSYGHIGYYLFGLSLTLIATELTKFSVGRLRPHFFAVCQPQLADGSNCSDVANQARYIEEYVCQGGPNVSKKMLRDVALSFPSGHASIFFYGMIYVILYLQMTLTCRISRLLKPLLQFVCLLAAWYVSLTRISDHKHHWTDVGAGMLMGSACALTVACFVARLFRPAHDGVKGNDTENTTANRTCASGLRSIKMSTNTPALPAYTFGTLPHLPPTHHHHQYAGHTYHNYGYVP